MSQLRSNAEKTPQDGITKYNEIQMDKRCAFSTAQDKRSKKQNVFDSESRSDLSFTGVSPCRREHRGDSQRSQRRNEDDQLLPEGEPIRILGNTSTEGFGEGKHSESIPEREHRSALCDIDYTSRDGCLHTKLTPE